MKIQVNRHDGHGPRLISNIEDRDTLIIGENIVSACFFDLLKEEAKSKRLIRLSLTDDGQIMFTTINETA